MKRKRIEPEEGSKSIRKVVFFCVIVAVLVLISFLIRFAIVLKNSKYDGNTRFTIAIMQKKEFRILSFDPEASTISSLQVKGKVTGDPPQRQSGVPVDGLITVTRPFPVPQDVSGALLQVIWHPTDTKNTITGVDLIRLYLFAKTVSQKNIHDEQLTLPAAESTVDKLVSQLFSDTKIIDDDVSIEVVNGTEMPGMAKRLERIISNAGGNVVALSSTHEVEKYSKIYYYQKPSYTLSWLKRMFGYTTVMTKTQGIADIRIVIGEDEVKTKKF